MDAQKKQITEAVGARIRYYRRLRDLSQEELALNANINPAYFGQVERGVKCPTVDTLCKIAVSLEISPAELLRIESLPDFPEADSQRVKELLSRVPPEKKEQVINLLESLVDML